jgi:hypothetical protein
MAFHFPVHYSYCIMSVLGISFEHLLTGFSSNEIQNTIKYFKS